MSFYFQSLYFTSHYCASSLLFLSFSFLVHSAFPHLLALLNFWICVGKWTNHAEVFSLSLFLSLSVSVSFHLSFFCFLLSFLAERKERHRVIGFPLIARVMLTVHKSCHWNSTSFIFRFCLGFFLCLFSSSSSSSHLVLQCELSRHASYLSFPPAFVFPGVSLGGFNCLDGPSVGYCVST